LRCLGLALLAGTLAAPITASAQSGETPTNSAVPSKVENAAQSTDAKSPNPTSTKPEELKHDYSQEGFVVEQYHSRYRFEADGTGRKETIARIRVQSEAGGQQ